MFSEHASDGRTYYINMDVAGKSPADGGENSWENPRSFLRMWSSNCHFSSITGATKKNSRMILNPNLLTPLCIPRHNLAPIAGSFSCEDPDRTLLSEGHFIDILDIFKKGAPRLCIREHFWHQESLKFLVPLLRCHRPATVTVRCGTSERRSRQQWCL